MLSFLAQYQGTIPSRRLFLNRGSLAWGEDNGAAIAVGELVTTNTAWRSDLEFSNGTAARKAKAAWKSTDTTGATTASADRGAAETDSDPAR